MLKDLESCPAVLVQVLLLDVCVLGEESHLDPAVAPVLVRVRHSVCSKGEGGQDWIRRLPCCFAKLGSSPASLESLQVAESHSCLALRAQVELTSQVIALVVLAIVAQGCSQVARDCHVLGVWHTCTEQQYLCDQQQSGTFAVAMP